ncbi:MULTISPECIES: pheST operon leader peptide PheM [Enterobacterales]|uniref:pheST attenuator peptide n=4 Tax=Enterobacterales TaxID=91347 RepID=A0AAJ5QLL3_9GAMM|nr:MULTISPECIES: pheST operon leader peptide PheM [Enterobacterales]EHR7158471.1 pheST operon leader peptide PheM [Salmonella enterica]MDU1190748.1 pheST operon leader peptide PheM [Enterobacteriaceae bacterium]HBR1454122.1 pheST operon leader peptide PheM [Klebsiella quasipneumoniae subsp. similipneumoniae]MBU2671326.1 pheST operon leader peptide PheM [Hafnia paralvei]MBW2959892.1 pheST operon leader peptide PheM [Hafnia paralvei]
MHAAIFRFFFYFST